MKQNKLFFITIVLTHDTDGNGNISTKSVQLRSYVNPNFNFSQKMSWEKSISPLRSKQKKIMLLVHLGWHLKVSGSASLAESRKFGICEARVCNIMLPFVETLFVCYQIFPKGSWV